MNRDLLASTLLPPPTARSVPMLINDAPPAAEIFSWADLDEVLRCQRQRLPAVRVIQGGQEVPSYRFCNMGATTGPGREMVVNQRLTQLFAEGATVILQGLERRRPRLAHLTRILESVAGHPITVNAFATPAEAAGLGEHADRESAWIAQVAGSKVWDLVPSAGVRTQIELRAGQWLWLPAGVPHGTRTTTSASLHLTFTVRAPKIKDLVGCPDALVMDGSRLNEPVGIRTLSDSESVARLARELSGLAGFSDSELVRRRIMDLVQHRRALFQETPWTGLQARHPQLRLAHWHGECINFVDTSRGIMYTHRGAFYDMQDLWEELAVARARGITRSRSGSWDPAKMRTLVDGGLMCFEEECLEWMG